MTAPPQGPFEEPAPEPKRHGCLFWGCLTALALGLVVIIAAALGVRSMRKHLLSFTATQPAALPAPHFKASQVRNAQGKSKRFQAAVRTGRSGTFRFSADDLNALIASDPNAKQWRNKVYFHIEGNRIFADASLPLDGFPGMNGRYLNGKIELRVEIKDGRLDIRPQNITVKGKPLPERMMAAFRQRNLADRVVLDPNLQKALARISSLTVRNSAIEIKTK